jgi:hypothetical protein
MVCVCGTVGRWMEVSSWFDILMCGFVAWMSAGNGEQDLLLGLLSLYLKGGRFLGRRGLGGDGTRESWNAVVIVESE